MQAGTISRENLDIKKLNLPGYKKIKIKKIKSSRSYKCKFFRVKKKTILYIECKSVKINQRYELFLKLEKNVHTHFDCFGF